MFWSVTAYYTASFGGLSRLIAFRRAGTLHYVGTDHLGGTIRVSDASFAPLDGMRYTPFDGSRDSGASLKTDHKFTGQIEDGSIGLHWYASRAYDPATGRFTAPDSTVPEPTNPQALNRYAYTLNNPLKFVDPSGHEPVDHDWRREFITVHGYAPGEQDQRDREFSLSHAGSGAQGSWTEGDWRAYTQVKRILGSSLLSEAGRSDGGGSLSQMITDGFVTKCASGGEPVNRSETDLGRNY